ncbi:hypothetical protein Rhopal_002102-T1 [Rhodotorula paludigena]|uniref:Protein HRI1 n=1 Tax=Rhodotorula paludigena TaxID=86838 RepID=A0AAV5GG39_9BASI|nr:hypothetical protein Rhopal_002102-T1 [Rhodotorula paludigena]
MEPLVSTRVSLRWPPGPAAELEDVLVIQGRSGFFLDLRTRRTSSQLVPGEGGRSTPSTQDAQVEWATAGWKVLLPPETGENHPRTRFDAVIDSRRSSSHPTSDDRPASDEGSFETLPDGDVLEHGVMLRPETGNSAPYEEVWRRLPLARDRQPPRILILEARDDQRHEHAFLGRVGDYELGLLDGPAGFGVVRRELNEEGEWVTVASNELGRMLPALATVDVTKGASSEMCR